MSQKEHEPQDPYVFWRMEGRADDATPLDLAAYRHDPELAEIESLMAENRLLLAQIAALTRPVHDTQTGQDEVLALRMLLSDMKTEFAAVYAETPPVFQGRWARVARMLGVEQ